ncbi:hypothetical protein ABZ352_35445 [Streptomyces griseofuscus]|uniref:hypothetical protein n=1 Tax=Streptomyces griseofuscus TaxID=146922 RepID=UPI00340DD0ED
MNHIPAYLHTVAARARLLFTAYAATEPVRLRARLTSLVLAASVLVPALAAGHTAGEVGSVLAVVLPILVGESARAKVSPVK